MGTTALTEAVFYILLSLDAPLHGYGIMQNVERLSGGRVRLAAGTLYGALTTLTERGWIEAVGEEFNPDFHEAVARFKAGDEKKGKVIDVIQRGYMLGDKVLRYVKVVVGE